jgi:hypothetical protein
MSSHKHVYIGAFAKFNEQPDRRELRDYLWLDLNETLWIPDDMTVILPNRGHPKYGSYNQISDCGDVELIFNGICMSSWKIWFTEQFHAELTLLKDVFGELSVNYGAVVYTS